MKPILVGGCVRCMICSAEMFLEDTLLDENEPIAEFWRCPKCQSGFKVDLKTRWVLPPK